MIGGHSSGSLSSQFIKLASGDTFVDTSTDLLRHQDWVTVVNAKAIAKLLQSSSDLVEVDSLLPPISLHHIHFCFFQDFNQTGFGHRKKQEKERLLIQYIGRWRRDEQGAWVFFKKKNLGFSSLLPSRTNLGFILEFESWRQIVGFQIQRDAMAGNTFGAGKVGWCCGARAIICPLPFQSSSLASVAYRIKCFFFFFFY